MREKLIQDVIESTPIHDIIEEWKMSMLWDMNDNELKERIQQNKEATKK